MKKLFKLAYILFAASIVFGGCAKREEDVSQETFNELQDKVVSVEELRYLTQKKYNDCIGEEGNQFLMEADVMIPEKISTGKVSASLPTPNEIEKMFCNNQKLKEVEVDDQVFEWQLFDEDGNIKKVYSFDDISALYTDHEVSGNTIDLELLNSAEKSEEYDEKHINMAKQVLNDLDYSVEEKTKEYISNEDHFSLTIRYAVLIDHVPVVEPELGTDYTHVVIHDDIVTQVGLAKKYHLIESENTKVLPLEELVTHVKNLYNDGMIQLPSEKINQIQLMYYVDSEEDLIPVWTFFADIFDEGQESVIAIFDARTGDMLYDEVNGKATINE